MPVAVNQPRPKEEKDPLDTILKGLHVATSIYNIKDAGAKADQLRAQTELQRQQTATQSALAEKQMATLDRENQGIVTHKDLLSQAGKYQAAKPDEPGAIKFRVQGEGGVGDVWLKPPKDPEAAGLKGMIQQFQLKEHMRKEEDAAFAKTPEGKLKNLAAMEKGRFDNVTMALTSLTGMENAYKSGDNTFSIVGDNNFTKSRTQWEEAIGRMQSGGAISEKEGDRFRSLIPNVKDSADVQRSKLIEMRNLMEQRLTTLGFKMENLPQLGINQDSVGLGRSAADPDQRSAFLLPKKNVNPGFISNAQAGSAPAATVKQGGHTYTLNPKTGKYE